jgi:peptide-methionine (S)-S-oxide reductase
MKKAPQRGALRIGIAVGERHEPMAPGKLPQNTGYLWVGIDAIAVVEKDAHCRVCQLRIVAVRQEQSAQRRKAHLRNIVSDPRALAHEPVAVLAQTELIVPLRQPRRSMLQPPIERLFCLQEGRGARPQGVVEIDCHERKAVSATSHCKDCPSPNLGQRMKRGVILPHAIDPEEIAVFMFRRKTEMPSPEEALKGRSQVMPITNRHFVKGVPILPPFPEGTQSAIFGLGCFWGAERRFWQLSGVYTTAVGYAGGYTPNPSYDEVCSGLTGHNEVVLVVFDPERISYEDMLRHFWEGHDPTQGMRQGNDVGTQYRSAIYTSSPTEQSAAEASRARYQEALDAAGRGPITTEILEAPAFYYAEDYHQQYLAKNPGGYCGLGGCGVTYPESADANR